MSMMNIIDIRLMGQLRSKIRTGTKRYGMSIRTIQTCIIATAMGRDSGLPCHS
jgi:hypothetical protein